MIHPKRIAVFASGSGSNLQALIDSFESGHLRHGEIVLVIASKPGIGAIERARKHGIDWSVFSKKSYESQGQFDSDLLERLEQSRVDIIVLAGYLGILSDSVVGRYERHILNVHPSLIPSFCGKGFYGLNVHRAVLESGVKITGATVHFVNAGVDEGAILLQETCSICPDDDEHLIQEKVLAIEHKLLPQAVEALAAGQVKWSDDYKKAFLGGLNEKAGATKRI